MHNVYFAHLDGDFSLFTGMSPDPQQKRKNLKLQSTFQRVSKPYRDDFEAGFGKNIRKLRKVIFLELAQADQKFSAATLKFGGIHLRYQKKQTANFTTLRSSQRIKKWEGKRAGRRTNILPI